MIALPPISTATVYMPTPGEIAAATAAYRAGWSQLEKDSRLTAGVDAQVRLLAGILKPMAIEAGLIPAPVAEVIPEAEPATSCDSAA